MRKEGSFFVFDNYSLNGGLNTANSPFTVADNEATGGLNFDLQVPGAVRKRSGHSQLNTTADSQLKTIGLGLWDKPGSTRVPIRAAGTKLQNFDPSAYTFTNLYEDTARTSLGTCTISNASPGVITFTAHGLVATDPIQLTTSGALPTGLTANTTYYVKTVLTANTFTVSATAGGTVINTSSAGSGTHTLYKFTTAFLNSSSTQPAVFNMFNTASTGVLWGVGAGIASLPYGVYSSTKVTQNGVPAPTCSSFTATDHGSGSTTLQTGTYRYTLVYRKTSTQALSNAGAEASVSVTSGHSVDLAWTLSNGDTTKYDKVYIYRSSLNGAAGFTSGDLAHIADITDTTYSDDGTNYSDSENVPRANSTVLDNSQLSSGTYTSITSFKRRLVTALNSVVYFSDINKSESWPTYQNIVIPSGGPITALGVIGLTSPLATDIDEVLVVFKQSECWVITGDGVLDSNDIPNWSLKFVNNAGASGQASVVSAEGYLFWVNYRGFFTWNGSGKPSRLSRKIWDKFQNQGDIDKSKLGRCFGFYSQKRNEVQWVLSSATYGEQLYGLRLDLTNTLGSREGGIGDTKDVLGVFCADQFSTPMYAGMGFLASASSTDETIYFGDNTGYVYGGFNDTGDGTGTTQITWQIQSPNHTFGSPNTAKRFHKVVAWILDNGDYDLTLQYWTDYKYATTDANSGTLAANDNPLAATAAGIWGTGVWGTMVWGSVPTRVKPLTFNLSPSSNGCEGDALKLRFSQTGDSQSPVLYGYSIYYTEIGSRRT